MRRALHPELAKRIVKTDAAGTSVLEHMTAERLLLGTQKGFGKQTPEHRRQRDAAILDLFENAASVEAVMGDWID